MLAVPDLLNWWVSITCVCWILQWKPAARYQTYHISTMCVIAAVGIYFYLPGNAICWLFMANSQLIFCGRWRHVFFQTRCCLSMWRHDGWLLQYHTNCNFCMWILGLANYLVIWCHLQDTCIWKLGARCLIHTSCLRISEMYKTAGCHCVNLVYTRCSEISELWF